MADDPSDAADPAVPGVDRWVTDDDLVELRGDDDASGRPRRRAKPRNALPPTVDRWRNRTVSGALLTASALGLQQVFSPAPETRPAIVIDAAGDDYDDDDPVVVDFDPDDPDETVVTVRPWLLHPREDGDR